MKGKWTEFIERFDRHSDLCSQTTHFYTLRHISMWQEEDEIGPTAVGFEPPSQNWPLSEIFQCFI